MAQSRSTASARANHISTAQVGGKSNSRALTATPPRHSHTANITPVPGSWPSLLQAKLTISSPNDVYEQEADRVADQVMRMPDPASAGSGIDPTPIRPLSLQRKCQECEEEKLQRKSQPPHTETPSAGLDTVAATLRQGGRPLDATTRSFFEPRFGVDFSAVRIHTDTQAAESAKSVNALAYTVGRDVVFNSGQYAPHRDSGKRLLAHELTHVVQQLTHNAVMLAAGHSSGHDSKHEQEADAAAAVRVDTPVRVAERAAPQVQRVAPVVAAPAAALALLKACAIGALLSMALDAAIQYGIHLWRLRRWPWERARETWEAYRHNWCLTAVSAVLGCLGAMAAHRWIQPLLRRSTPLGGAAGSTILGRLLMWLATQGILAPRMVVKWLGKLGCIAAVEAESLYPGITSEEALAEAPAATPAGSAGPESPA